MGKIISFIVAIPVVGTVFSFILNAVLAVLLTMTYTSLTQEQLIATLTFDNESNKSQIFIAHLNDAEGLNIDDYKLYGDQWRMDAGFIKMEYWANVFGVDSKYTLDRLEGRYKSIDDQNGKRHKSYQLEDHSLIDTMSFFVDTTYGSSVYTDIKLNTKYSVFKTPIGLMVREELIELVKKEKSLLSKTKSLFGFK
jgi:hypothetical protein